MDNLSAEELWEYLEDTEDIDLRDLKLYGYYSALFGKEDIARVIDLYFDKMHTI